MKSSSFLSFQVLLACLGLSSQALAETTTEDSIGVTAPVAKPDLSESDVGYSPAMPSDKQPKPEDVVYTPEYLKGHPAELEGLLQELIRSGNSDGLKALLPIYRQVPTADPSVFEWGEAIIAMQDRDFEKAVKLYRKLNAQLSESNTLRYQLSLALMANGELEAAKDQFEKLRSSTTNPVDVKFIDGYIKAIEKRDSWSFSGGVTYAFNKNVNSAAPEGTKIVAPNGAVLRNRTSPKRAHGVSYNFNADKKWSLSGITYLGLHTRMNGTWYFNEPNYSDLTARVGVGYGLRTPRSNLELIPFAQKRMYGFGEGGEDRLKAYATTVGARLQGNHWITPSWRYQGALEYGKDRYVETYDHLDGETYLASNTLLYAINKNQFVYGGADFSTKKTPSLTNAYNRYGLRLGWQKEWGSGISTSFNLGYARRFVEGKDFANIKRTDTDYSASASVWNRAWHWKGITPRLTFSYNETDSNQPFYQYKNKQAFLEFSKTF